MTLRALWLLVLAAPLVTAQGALLAQPSQTQPQTLAPQAQTPPQPQLQTVPRSGSASEQMVRGSPDLTLRCRSRLGSAQLLCTETSLLAPSKRPVEPKTLFGTSLSLHMANNLATKDSTAKFLRSVTGNAKFANKAAPTLMQLSKSMPARYGLAFAVIGSGALVVYQYLGGDGGQAEAKPLARGSSYEVSSSAFKKIGEVGADGVFRAAPAAKTP
jgi:hypothetical protein